MIEPSPSPIVPRGRRAIDLSAVDDVLSRLAERGWHTSAQVAVSVDDSVSDTVIGTVRCGSVPATRTTRFRWSCATKLLTVVALGILRDEGRIRFDDSLCAHVNSLDEGVFGRIRLSHLLTHTAGIAGDPVGDTPAGVDRVEMLDAIRAAGLEWEPGSTASYTPQTGWCLLSWVVESAAATPFDVFLAERIFAPLGLEHSTVRWDGRSPAGASEAALYDMSARPPAVLLDDRSDPEWSAGVSGSGPAFELVRVMDVLRGAREARLVSGETLREIRSAHRRGLVDVSNGMSLDWGLGIVRDRRLFSPRCSSEAFGHLGDGGSVITFGDARLNLAVAIVFDGAARPMAALARQAGVVTAVMRAVANH